MAIRFSALLAVGVPVPGMAAAASQVIGATYPLRHLPSIPGFDIPWVAILSGVFSPEECARLVAFIEAQGLAPAPINGVAGERMEPDLRNNDRVIFDDPGLAAILFARTHPFLPQVLHGGTLIGFNERFRGYRYVPGQRFAPHQDESIEISPCVRSQLTTLVYLDEGCKGGQTRLLDYELVFAPRTGSVLFFEHPMLHEGAEVTEGHKHVLRSDTWYQFPKRVGRR